MRMFLTGLPLLDRRALELVARKLVLCARLSLAFGWRFLQIFFFSRLRYGENRREGREAEDVFYHRKKNPVANADPPPNAVCVFCWVGDFPPQLFCN